MSILLTLKYRLPGNRDPLPKKKLNLLVSLKQIQIIKPEVIVTLGRHALTFQGRLSISKALSSLSLKHTQPVFTTALSPSRTIQRWYAPTTT